MDLDCDSEGVMRSSDEEMGRDKPAGGISSNHHYTSPSDLFLQAVLIDVLQNWPPLRESKGSESRRMVDITRDKPIKVAVRVVVPVRDHPKFNFVGKLLGPKGNSLKRLQEDTMCKMAVLGRGSMKDRHKEEELRASGDPKFQHLSEELHVEISAFATPAEAHARIAYALAEVRRFLVPDYNDDIRQEQMWEMQVLSSQRGNNNKTDGGGGGGSDPNVGGGGGEIAGVDCTLGEDRLSGNEDGNNTCIETGPQSPQDGDVEQHPALRGIQAETPALGETGALPSNASQLSPTLMNNEMNDAGGGGAAVNQSSSSAGRKRPLLTGGPRTSMTPTKRTVMSLLARARAAQVKQLPTFQRGTPAERTPTLVPLLREDYITGAVNLNLI